MKDLAALFVRLLTAAVFLSFGVGKFVAYDAEVRSFRGYGLPWPEAVVPALGALELGGGTALALGVGVRLVAVPLAGSMLGAIVTSGIQHGETISLTLAPAMLAGMLFLLWSGPGRFALRRPSVEGSADP
jgi:uncharacterized membrane protein YphA (DoxX/SURF4 family)